MDIAGNATVRQHGPVPRPRKGSEKATRQASFQLGVRIDRDLRERLRFYAYKRGLTQSDAIREVLDRHLPREIPAL